MGVFVNANELISVAIGIENNGFSFYSSLTKSTTNETLRGIYQHLANEERVHIETFKNMLASLVDYRPPETYTEDYELYLKALVNSTVFNSKRIMGGTAKGVHNDAEAVQIGINAEKDSILFYSEIQSLVRRPDNKIIGKIIEEEKIHLRKLLDLQESLKD